MSFDKAKSPQRDDAIELPGKWAEGSNGNLSLSKSVCVTDGPHKAPIKRRDCARERRRKIRVSSELG